MDRDLSMDLDLPIEEGPTMYSMNIELPRDVVLELFARCGRAGAGAESPHEVEPRGKAYRGYAGGPMLAVNEKREREVR